MSIAAVVALAGCGSTNKASTSSPSTTPPATTAPPTTVAPTTVPATTVLTAVEQTDLAYVHEQERAGADAYAVFAARYPTLPVFTNLASSQKTQLTTVTAMMARYRLADPSAGMAAGRYSDPTVQQLYNDMMATATSADHALDAVEHFEQHNLASLRTAASHTTRVDLATMYTNLEQASNSHITACNDAHTHTAAHS